MKRKKLSGEELPDFSQLRLSSMNSLNLTLDQIDHILQSNSYLPSSVVMEIISTLQIYYEGRIQQIYREVNSRPTESSYIS